MSNTLFPMDDGPSANPGFVPRPYQGNAVHEASDCLKQADSCSIFMATGLGKTEVACMLIDKMNARDGSLVITPLRELVTQTAARLRSRGVACGIEMGVLRSNEPVTVGCYASMLSRKRYENYLGSTKLLIVDESHLNFTPNAIQMLGYFREAGCKVVGMTASPDRSKGDPLSTWYGECAFNYQYKDALVDGWLVPAKLWLTVLEELDLSGFTSHSSDFDGAKVERLLVKEKNIQTVASMVAQHYEGQPSVVFCQSITHAELLREVLYRRGIECAIVHSDESRLTPEERKQHLYDFERGKYDVILNVGVLTLGWDHPPVRKVFIARPTKSKARYVQMFGRGTRALPGVVDGWATAEQRRRAIAESDKPCFEVFDFTDTSRHSDLVTSVDVLAPELDKKLLKRVRRSAENQSAGIDIDCIVDSERKAMLAEQAALDALELKKRAGLVADGRFGVYGRDLFAEAERPDKPKRRQWHMLFGKHKGQPLRDVPVGYLQWVLRESSCNNKVFMEAVAHEVRRRA